MTDPQTGNTRGFGFVTFGSSENAESVLAMGRMHNIDDKMVELKRAEPKGAKGGKGGKTGRGGKGGNNYGGGGHPHNYSGGYHNPQGGQFFQGQYGAPQYGAQGGYGAQQGYGGKGGDMGAYGIPQTGFNAYQQQQQGLGYGYGQGGAVGYGVGASAYGYGQGGSAYGQGAPVGYAQGAQDQYSQGFGTSEVAASQGMMAFNQQPQVPSMAQAAPGAPSTSESEVTTEAVMAATFSSQQVAGFPGAPAPSGAAPGSFLDSANGTGTLH